MLVLCCGCVTLPYIKNCLVYDCLPPSQIISVVVIWYHRRYWSSGRYWTCISPKCEGLPFVITLCLWSSSQFSIYVTMHIFHPIWINFASGNSWSSVSNALVKSIYITSSAFPSSINLVMRFKRVITFVWNDLSFIHPQSCFLLYTLFFSTVFQFFFLLTSNSSY